ncbi:hypothetical protein [Priestia megaterium]|uniref:hypothetical protein n=1 Tax=Priestia megaterium TaxID=1404 RepID=UPI0025B2189B|nr:hypothetical protein [Priestia megaterium]MDN3233415.1 hypothetical protein [Priestia megaterium]
MYEKINRLELYKEMYQKELEVKETLTNRFISNLSVLTFASAGLAFCVKNVHDIQDDKVFPYFLVFMGIAILSIIALIIVFIGFVPGETYYIPTPEILEQYYQKLVSHYTTSYPNDEEDPEKDEKDPEELADNLFSEHLYTVYKDATTNNMEINHRRFNIISRANTFLFSTIVGTLLALACYVPTFFEDDANVQKVEVVKPKIVDEKKE